MLKIIKDKLMTRKINRALGFKLSSQQIKYIFNNKNTFTGRIQGKTTAHAIKLCLDEELLKNKFKTGIYSDEGFGLHYNYYFKAELYFIHEKLKKAGIKVAEII